MRPTTTSESDIRSSPSPQCRTPDSRSLTLVPPSLRSALEGSTIRGRGWRKWGTTMASSLSAFSLFSLTKTTTFLMDKLLARRSNRQATKADSASFVPSFLPSHSSNFSIHSTRSLHRHGGRSELGARMARSLRRWASAPPPLHQSPSLFAVPPSAPVSPEKLRGGLAVLEPASDVVSA